MFAGSVAPSTLTASSTAAANAVRRRLSWRLMLCVLLAGTGPGHDLPPAGRPRPESRVPRGRWTLPCSNGEKTHRTGRSSTAPLVAEALRRLGPAGRTPHVTSDRMPWERSHGQSMPAEQHRAVLAFRYSTERTLLCG